MKTIGRIRKQENRINGKSFETRQLNVNET